MFKNLISFELTTFSLKLTLSFSETNSHSNRFFFELDSTPAISAALINPLSFYDDKLAGNKIQAVLVNGAPGPVECCSISVCFQIAIDGRNNVWPAVSSGPTDVVSSRLCSSFQRRVTSVRRISVGRPNV